LWKTQKNLYNCYIIKQQDFKTIKLKLLINCVKPMTKKKMRELKKQKTLAKQRKNLYGLFSSEFGSFI
jgi:hypothetical protein